MTRKKQMAKRAPEPFDYDDGIAFLAIPPLYEDASVRDQFIRRLTRSVRLAR